MFLIFFFLGGGRGVWLVLFVGWFCFNELWGIFRNIQIQTHFSEVAFGLSRLMV